MPGSIEDQVIDFYHELFEQVFSERFRPQIADRIRRNAVIRQVEESADAASQSLTRFFRNEQLTEPQTAGSLSGFVSLPSLLKFETIANPNIPPESVVEDLLTKMPCPKAIRQARQDAVYRVALHSVVQVLMLVGRVMAEWERLKFSSTFELPRRVVEQLNLISEQLSAVRGSGQSAKDERFELTYRDYLLQRFHRVEAGTVRMTTSMDVDLRELFVMPRVLARPQRKKQSGAQAFDPTTPMNLAAARAFFGGIIETDEQPEPKKQKRAEGIRALNQIKRHRRNVIIGLPGSGKSTLFEWLQLKLAAIEVEYILGGGQAIPLLLKVRELNPKKLPTGAALIEKATASQDRTALMPEGWFERQMQAGRVLFMLDGLDETEPELCDDYILPWLVKLCADYPNCAYLVSSRPVGYPPGALQPFKFKECNLMDFGDGEIAEYARHWCTAIRLARNEPETEARREGVAEGEQIVTDFKRNSYVQNLAKNPLMLSAICLVNNFERGQLPEDRAMLYKLCVEGLLHNWDQRRGIRSEFTLEEKLRACREVALAMQAEDRAEYETKRVQKIFSVVLGDPDRADKLLEHIRYRTGLLIERRAGMFAFAHLTFQEYLAAKAIYEGSLMNIDAKRLADEHNDGRWKEVIALYCGSSSATAARKMIHQLITQPNTGDLAEVLAEAYLSSGPKLSQDSQLRQKVLKRIAVTPGRWPSQLRRFPPEEVLAIANFFVSKSDIRDTVSEAFFWLFEHQAFVDEGLLFRRIRKWHTMFPSQIFELVFLLHRIGTPNTLSQLASYAALYESPGLRFQGGATYSTQAEGALAGLVLRYNSLSHSPAPIVAFRQIFRALSASKFKGSEHIFGLITFGDLKNIERQIPQDSATRVECASLARQWAQSLSNQESKENGRVQRAIKALNEWADSLEQAASDESASKLEPKPQAPSKRTAKKPSKRR